MVKFSSPCLLVCQASVKANPGITSQRPLSAPHQWAANRGWVSPAPQASLQDPPDQVPPQPSHCPHCPFPWAKPAAGCAIPQCWSCRSPVTVPGMGTDPWHKTSTSLVEQEPPGLGSPKDVPALCWRPPAAAPLLHCFPLSALITSLSPHTHASDDK